MSERAKVHFTPTDILQKDFKQKMRGYDPTDVDSFLDMVIEDYRTFTKTTDQLNDKNARLTHKIKELETNPISRPSYHDDDVVSKQDYKKEYQDVLERLNRLESKVFGK